MTISRKTRGYDNIFVNKKYYADMMFNGYSVCGNIFSDGSIVQPQEKLYKLGYYSKTFEYTSARFLNNELIDFVLLKKDWGDPNKRQGNGSINEVDILYNDKTYTLAKSNINSQPNTLFVNSENENERIFYTLYYEEIIDTYNARTSRNTHLWYNREGNVAFVFNENNPSFNGIYPKYSNGTYFNTYISQDGKNIAFEFATDNDKRQAMFVIKSKELIKRFGKEFASAQFLSSLFTTGKFETVKVFSSEGEFEGELFSISYKKPNHIEIEFCDGEKITEDDGEILVNFVKLPHA